MSERVYLGDAVYAEMEGEQVKLTVRDNRDAPHTQKIYLEPKVVDALLRYLKTIGWLADDEL
jgi:hypothetical protein